MRRRQSASQEEGPRHSPDLRLPPASGAVRRDAPDVSAVLSLATCRGGRAGWCPRPALLLGPCLFPRRATALLTSPISLPLSPSRPSLGTFLTQGGEDQWVTVLTCFLRAAEA